MKQLAIAKLIIRSGLIVLLVASMGACLTRSRNGNANGSEAPSSPAPLHININTASAQELEQLPGVGKVIAERIVAYREQFGRFRRPAELMMVNGVSDKKFREIREMIVVE